MKWLAALGGLLIGGMVFSPMVGLVLGILGAVFVPASFKREREPGEPPTPTPARPVQHPFAVPYGTPEAAAEEELTVLREQVLRLERRLASVERDLAVLKASGETTTAPVAPQPHTLPATTPQVPTPPVLTPRPVPAQAASLDASRATLKVPQPAPVTAPAMTPAAVPPVVTQPAATTTTAWTEPPRRAAPPVAPPPPPSKSLAERLPAPLRNFTSVATPW